MELEIRTLTPLWTGGADSGKVDRIHETSILGSLRWWYEAVVRGLGGLVCDPSQGRCQFDAKRFDAVQYAKSGVVARREYLREAGLCDVCQVFGTTGWRRRFRLRVVVESVSSARIEHTVSLKCRQYTDGKGKTHTPTWYFRDPTHSNHRSNTPKEGSLRIEINSLDQDLPPAVIAGLVQFVADWSAIGARAQMGFGVVALESGRLDTRPFYDRVTSMAGNQIYPDIPSLQNVFLARISPKSGQRFGEQDTFILKHDLRQLFSGDKRLRHFIMGTTTGKRMAAKIKMSRPYDGGLMRVWGWIPEKLDVYKGNWSRDTVVAKIHQHLKANYTLTVWREMGSPRDSITPSSDDAKAFMQSLVI